VNVDIDRLTGILRKFPMDNRFCGRWLPGFRRAVIAVILLVAVAPGLCSGESEVGRANAADGRISIHSGIWAGSGLYSHHVWPIPAYPGIQWMYPCFPYVNCMAFQQFQRLDRHRQRLQKPEPVFGPEASVVGSEMMDAWRAGLQPAIEPFRTEEREILPEHLDRSLVRPEFEGVGRVLPQFPVEEN
jgi:hypothetical protein